MLLSGLGDADSLLFSPHMDELRAYNRLALISRGSLLCFVSEDAMPPPPSTDLDLLLDLLLRVFGLLHFFGIPLRLKKGLIKKVTAKGMNLSNLLALNVDSSSPIDRNGPIHNIVSREGGHTGARIAGTARSVGSPHAMRPDVFD